MDFTLVRKFALVLYPVKFIQFYEIFILRLCVASFSFFPTSEIFIILITQANFYKTLTNITKKRTKLAALREHLPVHIFTDGYDISWTLTQYVDDRLQSEMVDII